ncbi:MAG: hypothetical protein ACE5PV_27570 [Candidatus Poribacteria bacterium]
MIPDFNDLGDLPAGIHKASIDEIINAFGSGSPQREALTRQFTEIIDLACSTGQLCEVFIFGSYITVKLAPNDIDLLLIMSAEFDSEDVVGRERLIFDAMAAQHLFNASIWWITQLTEPSTRNLILEQIQMRRDGNRRGIVEVIL